MTNILARDVLVLMACSATKKPFPARAIDFYDGPLWQTLRMHKGDIPDANVCVLSGNYGFVNCGHHEFKPYDARLTAGKAHHLISRGIFARNTRFGLYKRDVLGGDSPFKEAHRFGPIYQAVIVVGSQEYRRVFDFFVDQFIEHKLVSPEALILKTHGMIGEQRQQLGAWLRQFNPMEKAA